MAKIEQLPIATINIKILKFWSFILDHNYKRYLALITTTLHHIGQYISLFNSSQTVDELIKNLYTVVLWFNTLFRVYYLILNRSKFENILNTMAIYYLDIKNKGDDVMQKILVDFTKSVRSISYLNMFTGLLTIVGLYLYPMFASKRVLPYDISFPGLNQYECPYYEIIYTYNILVSPIGCSMYIPFTSIIVTYMSFSIIMLKILQHKLKSLSSIKPETILSIEIAQCVEYHMKIICFVDEINNLTCYVFLAEFLTFGTTLCVLLFMLNVVSSFVQVVIVCWFILMIVLQIFLAYYFAHGILEESLKVSEAVYDAPWYEFSISNQKKLLLILRRSQKPLKITLGNLYPMTLETFQSLLNVTYTYFTLLRRIYG